MLQGEGTGIGEDGITTESECGGEDTGKQVVVGICAMAKKSQSKPMKEILTRLQEFEYLKIVVFSEEVILKVSLISPASVELSSLHGQLPFLCSVSFAYISYDSVCVVLESSRANCYTFITYLLSFWHLQ